MALYLLRVAGNLELGLAESLLLSHFLGPALDVANPCSRPAETQPRGIYSATSSRKDTAEKLGPPVQRAGLLQTVLAAPVDLSTHCLNQFVEVVFAVDLRGTIPEFFTQKWYGDFAMKRITSTFEDYMADYSPVLHPSLTDILVEELSDELLIRYLSSVRNRSVKFRRHVDPYTDKFKDDVLTVFAFFQKYPDSFAATIKQKWRLVDWLLRLLEAEKGPALVAVYETFKTEYWDLQLTWVEGVIRTRDDFERSMVSAIKAKAAELSVEMGIETLMSRVR